MGTSQRLRLRDVRDACRLVGECREVGASAVAWQRRLHEGLLRLTGADVGIGGGAVFDRGMIRPLPSLMIDIGWATWAQQRVFHDHVGGGFRHDPSARAMMRAWPDRARLITRLRREVIDDDQWRRSPVVARVYRPSGLGDSIISLVRLADGSIHGVTMHRAEGERPFDLRTRRLVSFVHAEAAPLIGGPLAAPKAEPRRLPPRLQQTLDLLLEGLSEKQIAHRLGLSRHTVHEHVGRLYHRLGVSSRAELFARHGRTSRP